MNLGTLLSDVTERLRTLPTGAKVVLGVAVAAVVGVSSVLMYEAYDYVQHDNEFCLECHLMQDPYEEFARSAHRGLGCKACHQPGIAERTEMGLAQIVENPDSIRVHAHVPNEVCAECHIEGNPEEWRAIANTAGHRIHLESDDPALEGLNCVECHSSGVHQFTPTDMTCGQAACHESTDIRLGEMADLTIHCVTCHDFARPVASDADAELVARSLQPQAQECLACHQMRSMLGGFPADEPHDADCSICHNPHEQVETAEAALTCATGGCHDSPEAETAFHRGLDPGVLNDCVSCHEAHHFNIHMDPEANCLECHTDIYEDAPGGGPITSGPLPEGHPAIAGSISPEPRGPSRPIQLASAGPLGPGLARLALAAHAPADSQVGRDGQGGPRGAVEARDELDDPEGSASPLDLELPGSHPAVSLAVQQDTFAFWHSQHRGVECTACHSMQNSHGAVTVTSIRDCRSCHHTGEVAVNCQSCHSTAEVRRLAVEVRRTMDIQLGSLDRPSRMLPFDHQAHQALDCARCHTDGLVLSATGLDCESCHTEHHQPNTNCMACHAEPAEDAHTVQVHVGCAGSGCHEAVPTPVADVPRTREFCLVCHQGLTDHRPGRNCENCHTLPQARSAQAGAPAGPHFAEP